MESGRNKEFNMDDEDEQMMLQQMGIGIPSIKGQQEMRFGDSQVSSRNQTKELSKSQLKKLKRQQRELEMDKGDDEEDHDSISQISSEMHHEDTNNPKKGIANRNQETLRSQLQQIQNEEDDLMESQIDYNEDLMEDDADEEQEEDDPQQKTINLVQAINENPYDFASYQILIELYRQQGLFEELREARQRAHSLFCLPSEMWIEWIEDEQRVLTPQDDPSILVNLCETATKDYRYYKVCKKYCKLLGQLYDIQQGGVTALKVREGFEKVLQIYGLDVNRSGKFWNLYLEFEEGELAKLEQSSQSDAIIKEQVSRIRSIYRRRVIFPTEDMLVTWSEYQKWEKDPTELKRVEEKYHQACSRINDVVNFEEKFQNAYRELEDNSDLEQMLNLLGKDLEDLAKDNFNYIMLYFERILSEYTLNHELWTLYLNYTDEKCKTKQMKQDIYEKAVKNCAHDHEIWLGYFRELEKNEQPAETIINAANQALSNGQYEISLQFQFEIFKYLCEYQVRQIPFIPIKSSSQNSKNFSIEEEDESSEKEGLVKDEETQIPLQVFQMRAMFKDSIENLKESNKEESDQMQLKIFVEKLELKWAEIEAFRVHDKKQVQDIMEAFVKKNGAQIVSWSNYIKLMRVLPDSEKALRGLFKRGLQFIKDNKVLFAELWLDWEKQFSTIQSVDHCIKFLKKNKIYSLIGQVPLSSQPNIVSSQQEKNPNKNLDKNQQRESKIDIAKGKAQNKSSENDIDSTSKKRSKPDTGREVDEKNSLQNKRQKQDQSHQEKEKVLKVNSEEQKQELKKNKRTLYFSSLSDATEEEDIQDLFTRVLPDIQLLDIRLIRDEQMQKKGFAYVDVPSYELAERSLKLHKHNLKGSMIQVHIYKPPEGENTQKTVYVNNLPFTCDERKLEEVFSRVGSIKEVRLKRDQSGKIRGFAYVEFHEFESVKKAVAQLNKSKLDGRTISVELCKTKEEAQSKYGFTIHFKNLDYSLTDEVLRKYFEEHFGEVKRLNLTKDEKGRSMGFGNVEFVEEQSFKKAIQQKEIRDLGKRIIILSRSLRQITEPKQSDDQAKQKKREAKQERKTLLSSMIDEIKNAQVESAPEQQDQTEKLLENKGDQALQKSQSISDQVEQLTQQKVFQKQNEQKIEELSNNDFKKLMFSKKK